jgi:transcriptional regulator with XRE-family HTH domain
VGRASKGTHVLAKLRQELGLHQKEMADRVGLHWRTIQDIERGKPPLSRRNAMRISEKTGVSVNWLLRNDPAREIVNVSGKKWSHKDRQAFEARSKRWPGVVRQARMWELGVCATLFKDYLLVKALLEGVPNPTQASFKWHQCQKDALIKFASSYEPLRAKRKSELIEKVLNKEAIQEIKGDLDAISEELESLPSEGSLLRLLIALATAGTSNVSDVLAEFDKHKETTPDRTPIEDAVRMIATQLQQLTRGKLRK